MCTIVFKRMQLGNLAFATTFNGFKTKLTVGDETKEVDADNGKVFYGS
jgi:hypothetical protein